MKFGAARQLDSAGKKPLGTRVGNGVLDSTADLVDDIDRMNAAVHGHCDMRPADDVRLDGSNIGDLAFLNRDKACALFGPLSRMCRPCRLPQKTTCGFW